MDEQVLIEVQFRHIAKKPKYSKLLWKPFTCMKQFTSKITPSFAPMGNNLWIGLMHIAPI